MHEDAHLEAAYEERFTVDPELDGWDEEAEDEEDEDDLLSD